VTLTQPKTPKNANIVREKQGCSISLLAHRPAVLRQHHAQRNVSLHLVKCSNVCMLEHNATQNRVAKIIATNDNAATAAVVDAADTTQAIL
jgi:hypothetical protein